MSTDRKGGQGCCGGAAVRYTNPAMAHTEPTLNTTLADALRPMLPRSNVAAEETDVVSGQPRRRPDILVTMNGRSPVAIEAEFMPARTVEDDARARLGLRTTEGAREIEVVIAVRYPAELRDAAGDVAQELRKAKLSYVIWTHEGARNNQRQVRFPEAGWLDGAIEDLADMAHLVSVPQRAVDEAAENLERGIDNAAAVLTELNGTRPAINIEIARVLGMENVEQTRRMAAAIVANAMVFHERIVGMHPDADIMTLSAIERSGTPNAQLIAMWNRILEINYFPIFDIARRIIECLPAEPAARVIRILSETGNYVHAAGIDNAHDLTGRVFQRLIADRKYLATFYTRPASAALLAQLAVAKLEGVDWSDAEAIGALRIADFACGTGALLSAVYAEIARQNARTGGDPQDLHGAMMENVLMGFDVMPSAVHITAATLAGMEPTVPYSTSRLYTMPYGRQPDGSVKLGSLEFLAGSRAVTLTHAGGGPAMRVGGATEEVSENVYADIPDESLDLVIMNPPFTRATNHEGAHFDITNPAFAAFNSTRADQTEMGDRINRLGRASSYHGNAGIPSAFAALAHRKIKPGGVLALVIPLTAANGMSWEKLRTMLARDYEDMTVLSIAANGRDMSFSSDTGMAECLVIAQKLKTPPPPHERSLFASFGNRPQGLAHARALAGRLLDGSQVRQIEDGPYGGTPLTVGEALVGETITAPVGLDGESWSAVRLADSSLAQTAYALARSRLWLPGVGSSVELQVAAFSDIGRRGWYHLNIAGSSGPFDRAHSSPTATYPSLWNHDATKETRMVVEPDSQLLVRQGMEAKAATVWATASRAHVNCDFRFNSQPLAAAFTEVESIGGRAWPNAIFADRRFDYAFTLWGNSTLGLVSYWWHSTRQQSGRGSISHLSAESLPVLDLRLLSDDQLLMAQMIFEDFRDKEFLPAYLADADPSRDELDRRVVMDLLGFDEEVYRGVRRLAQKWCAEPSVHGGKPRPRDARALF